MSTTNACWYESSTGNHQGLVIDEATGRNVAVCYDKSDAALFSAAPELLSALQAVEERITNAANAFYVSGKRSALQAALDGWKAEAHQARAAIAKAKGVNR